MDCWYIGEKGSFTQRRFQRNLYLWIRYCYLHFFKHIWTFSHWLDSRCPLETALLIFLYYTNQSSGGGFHASSHLMCFLTMVLGELLFLFSFLLPYSLLACIGISVISLFFMWIHPLVLHPNKSYLKKKAPQLIKRSRQILLLEAALLVAFILLNIPDIIQTGSLAFLLSAVSRNVPILKHTGIVDFS